MSNSFFFKWKFQNKCTSISKKRIRRNIWKKRGYFSVTKAFSLAKSVSAGNSKSFLCDKQVKTSWSNLKFHVSNNSQSLKMFPLTNVLNSLITVRAGCSGL